jgi:hypothetical protein
VVPQIVIVYPIRLLASVRNFITRTAYTSDVGCPLCGAEPLYFSPARWWERIFKARTDKRLFRCLNCNWRGWLSEHERVLPPESQDHRHGDPIR